MADTRRWGRGWGGTGRRWMLPRTEAGIRSSDARGPRVAAPRRRGALGLAGVTGGGPAGQVKRPHVSWSPAAASPPVVFAGLTLKRYLRVVDAVARLLRRARRRWPGGWRPILERVGLVPEELEAGFARMTTGSPNF